MEVPSSRDGKIASELSASPLGGQESLLNPHSLLASDVRDAEMSWITAMLHGRRPLGVLPEMKPLSQEKLEVKREGKMLMANKPLSLPFHEPETIFPGEFCVVP